MQTNLFNARNGKVQGTEKRRDFADKLCLQMQTMGARFADKVCLKMQTNFADKPLQDTPPPNADKRLQKCRRARWGFGQIADELCRQRLSATRAGTPAFLFVYTTLQGLSTVKCRQGLSTAKCRQGLSTATARLFLRVVRAIYLQSLPLLRPEQPASRLPLPRDPGLRLSPSLRLRPSWSPLPRWLLRLRLLLCLPSLCLVSGLLQGRG